MDTPQLYQYAVLWHPTEKDAEDNGTKSKVIVEPATVLAADASAATMLAARAIPEQYADQLDQVQIAVRPF